MTNKTDAIAATIDGALATFRLRPHPEMGLQMVEARLGKSLFVVFRGIAEGSWTTADFITILSYAHVGAPNRLLGFESELVVRAMRKNPPGLYAPLVAKVIEAFLFGLPEAEAVFSEDAADADG